jgi:hypothetical protein
MIDSNLLLATIPPSLRDPLIEEYRELCKAFNEGRWKLAALDGGRFCEIAYTIVHGLLSGAFASSPQKPKNFVQACRNLEVMSPAQVGDRSLRILIPRLLPCLYEVRNNRNVGHVGGDVVSNKMDATFIRESTAWLVAEFVRITHGVTTIEAQAAVDALVERTHPLVWEIGTIKRVLAPSMKISDKVLVLIYSTPGWITRKNLRDWTRDKNLGRVLQPLFDKQLIEMDGDLVTITPLGAIHVESKLLR